MTLEHLRADQEIQSSVTLRLKQPSTMPVEADAISPDRFAGCSLAEIAALPLLYGRRWVTVSEVFTVSLDANDTGPLHITLIGDLRHVKRIGEGMQQGRITVHGDVGMHLGAKMRGGEIVVHGNAGAWAGAHLSGGRIRIHGNAGPMLGAAYVGEKRGMRGGVIIVDGDAGPRAGERMRRGLIVVQGDLGPFAGARIIAGSIVVFGALGVRAGAGMKRGSIVALGGVSEELLPTFRYTCSYRPVFLRYYLRRFREWALPVTSEQIDGLFHRYVGDITSLGKGEILIYGGG